MSQLHAIFAQLGLTNSLLLLVGLILTVVLFLLIILVRRQEIKSQDFFAILKKQEERTERMVRDEFGRNRQESAGSARLAREEIGSTLIPSSNSYARLPVCKKINSTAFPNSCWR
jgi:hypothetical protein